MCTFPPYCHLHLITRKKADTVIWCYRQTSLPVETKYSGLLWFRKRGCCWTDCNLWWVCIFCLSYWCRMHSNYCRNVCFHVAHLSFCMRGSESSQLDTEIVQAWPNEYDICQVSSFKWLVVKFQIFTFSYMFCANWVMQTNVDFF